MFIPGLRRGESWSFYKAMEGQNSNQKDLDLGLGGDIVQNARFDRELGSVTKRAPLAYFNSSVEAAAISSVYHYYQQSSSTSYIFSLAANLLKSSTSGTLSTVWTWSSSSGKRFTAVTYKDLAIISTGYDNIIQSDGAAAWELGSCKAGAATSGGSLDANAAYKYQIVFNTAVDGSGTNVINGAISNTITTTTDNKTIPLTNIPLGTTSSPAILSRVVYRTEGGGSTYYKIAVIGNNTATTYTDNNADTTATQISTVTDDMPKGKYLYVDQERLFVAGDTATARQSWAYYSAQDLPHWLHTGTADISTTAPAESYEVFAQDDGDTITGIVNQLGTTYIFKQNSIRPWYVTGTPTTWTTGSPVTKIGCLAPYSIASTPYGIVYLGWGYFYLFNGQYSDIIMDDFNVTESILDSRRYETVGFLWNNLYLATYTDAVGGNNYHDRVLVYDLLRKKLSVDRGGPLASGTANINCFASFKGASEWGTLYAGDSVLGWIYVYDRGLVNTILSSKSDIDVGTHTKTEAMGEASNPTLSKFKLDNMESYTSDSLARLGWVTSETTEKIPPDLGTGADGARTVGGTGSITVFAISATTGYTIVTSAAHTLEENDSVTITGTTNYNGTYTAVRVATDTFEILKTYVANDATGTWTGNDVTLTEGTYNYTSLTVAAGKILNLSGNTTIKVMGNVSVTGVIAGGSSLNLYAVYVTVAAAGSILNTNMNIRCNTYSNSGTVDDNYTQGATFTYTDQALGNTQYDNKCTPTASMIDHSFTTYGSYQTNSPPSVGTVVATFLAKGTITKVNFRWYAYASGSTYSGKQDISLYYSGAWHSIWSDNQTNYGPTTTEVTGSWANVEKIQCTNYVYTAAITTVISDAYYYEMSTEGTTPVIDAINSAAGTTTDFVNALEVYAEDEEYNELTRSLKVDCANGAITLNEYLTKTITALDISASADDTILIDVMSNRSGTNFQFGIGESAATDNLVNVPVTTANVWETISLDFSSVADASKNAIIKLGIKFTNTDSFNRLYVDNIRTGRYNGTSYLSPRYDINAGTLGKIYWNENLDTSGDVTFYTRSSDTSTDFTSFTDDTNWHATTLTNPAGTTIPSTAYRYFQFKAVLVSTDTTGKLFPWLYKADGFVIKFDYYKEASAAETSVEFRYRTGWRNFDLPMDDKIYKKICSIHEGTTGTFNLIVEADKQDTQNYTFSGIDLATYPYRYVSNFTDDMYGKELRLEWYKNDSNDFKIQQYGVLLEDMPLI
jgi:hypothetical protein